MRCPRSCWMPSGPQTRRRNVVLFEELGEILDGVVAAECGRASHDHRTISRAFASPIFSSTRRASHARSRIRVYEDVGAVSGGLAGSKFCPCASIVTRSSLGEYTRILGRPTEGDAARRRGRGGGPRRSI